MVEMEEEKHFKAKYKPVVVIVKVYAMAFLNLNTITIYI
jgi:hypothetical protein